MNSPLSATPRTVGSRTPARALRPQILPHIQRTPPKSTPRPQPAGPLFTHIPDITDLEDIPPTRSIVDAPPAFGFDAALPQPSPSIRHDYQPDFSFRPASPSRDQQSWVTVFGFEPRQTSDVLSYLSRVGTIIQRSSSAGNSIHVKYGDPIQATSALSLNGTSFAPGYLLGVVPAEDLPLSGVMDVSQASVRQQHPAQSLMVGEPEKLFLRPRKKSGFFTKVSEFVFG
ncbi:hypothetical protein GEMRC1_005412 [Eukaryota sp. GEM-RC1]